MFACSIASPDAASLTLQPPPHAAQLLHTKHPWLLQTPCVPAAKVWSSLPRNFCFLCCRGNKRLFLLDYDGTLMPSGSINARPTEEVLHVLRGLCADPANVVFIISGRARQELSEWFGSIVSLLGCW